MMMNNPDETRTISTRAIALLAGEQHARIDVHGAGEDRGSVVPGLGNVAADLRGRRPGGRAGRGVADCQGAARRIPERLDPKLLNIEIGDEAHLPAISVGFREISECGVSTHTLTPAPLGPRGTRPATSSARDGSTGSASWRPP